MKTRCLALMATLAGLTVAQPAMAQRQACGDRGQIIERLSVKYGETRQSMGLNHNNGMVEVFASADTGTWTILITMPTGMSCLMAAGENWEGQPEEATRSGSNT